MSAVQVNSPPLRVLIVDRHEVSRAAIRALLQTEGLDVVADVSNGDEALAVAAEASPDIVIVDIGAGEPPPLTLARSLGSLSPPPAVLLASSRPAAGDLGGYPFLAKADICAYRLQETHVSLQAYHDNITAKTGKTPEELADLAGNKGLVKPSQVVAWLKDEYGLGHGHAMAVVATIKKQSAAESPVDEKIARHFAGKKAGWRPFYDTLVAAMNGFGSDTDVAPGASYLSLRRAAKKFAIVQVTTDRLDLGLKLKGIAAAGRLESAGSWNAMVTHRVRIHAADEVDQEVLGWLEQAYARA
jgi:CheY-like chemotaxis protein